ncbi:MAG: SLBB domain-containing protein [Opitutales bacterium]|nr:SLBB domain-containing protein [Opitutales bacterium]
MNRLPLLTLCFALLFTSGFANTPTQMDLLNDIRRIVIGDRLVYQVAEERAEGTLVFVNDQGMVEIPLLGLVRAEGITCRELAFRIKEKLEVEFFHRATVLVRHQHADNSRGRVNIVGRVARPGPLNIPADQVMTVSSAILQTGGFLPSADSRNVLVRRQQEGEEDRFEEIRVNVRRVLEEGDFGADLPVRPEDIIVVPESAQAGGNYYITGAVSSPGEFKMPADGADVTLSQAILRAGGFAQFANQSDVIVIRQDPENPGEQIRLRVNVKAILEEGRRSEDINLKADDIIRVREVLFAF